METISHSLLTFLLNSLWQIPVIAGAAAVACRLMRNGPAGHRHAVWVAALAASVLLPLASVRSAGRDASTPFSAPAAPQLFASETGAAGASAPSTSLARRTVAYGPNTGALLMGAYLLFVGFGMARLAWAWKRTVQIRDSAGLSAAPSGVRQVWERCLAAFGLDGVELLASPSVASPVAAGAWRRTIILPSSLFDGASEEVLTTAIGHEMAHLARHDFGLNVLYQLLYAPIAFHPAAWLIVRGIEETREMACDELVTRKLLDAAVYARSMVSIAGSMMAVPQPGYTLGVFDGDILERRIKRLLERPVANLKRARWMLAAGMTGLAACAVIASGVAWTAQAQTTDPAGMDSAIKAARASLNALMTAPADTQRQSETHQALLDVLARDSGNQEALNGMMTYSMLVKQPMEGRQWALKMVALYPKEKTSYYCVGFSDWSAVYPPVTAARTAAGLARDSYAILPDAGTRQGLRAQYAPLIDEGMQMLNKAIEMDPQYVDAMAYLNLMYRLKAYVAETTAEAATATAVADEWVGKALAAKKLAASTPAKTGSWMAAPPPPPPPPPPPYYSDNVMASDAPPPATAHRERPGTFLQVLGGGNVAARKLIVELTAAGFPAGTVMTATPGSDPVVRVMVGPYPDDGSLTAARSKLETSGYRIVRTW